MSYKFIKIEIEDGILILNINRPEKLNALSVEVFSEMEDILESVRSGAFAELKGLILSGEKSKAFIAGADIAQMNQMTPNQAEEFAFIAQSITLRLEQLPLPVVAAVDGFALGGGCEMALACDFIFATERAAFGQPEVKLGLIPGFGGCVRLKERVGLANARRLIYTGGQVSAFDAYSLGLVDQLFASREEMMAHAKKLIRQISQNSLAAVSICKSVINRSLGKTTEEALAIERQGFYDVFETENKKIGVEAFLAKRNAEFKNSL